MRAIWSAAQIQGGRDYQEDFFAVVEDDCVHYQGEKFQLDSGSLPKQQCLLVLADGMGGMGHGDLAAKITIEYFIKLFLLAVASGDSVESCFRKSAVGANQAIADEVTESPELEGMGATLIALLWDGQNNQIYWVSIGDSLVYQSSINTPLQKLNEKHTWGAQASQLVEARKRYSDEELQDIDGALCSAVDGSTLRFMDIQVKGFPLNEGDFIIIASDGLETIPEEQIGLLCQSKQMTYLDVGTIEHKIDVVTSALSLLIDTVEQAQISGQDNTTIIVLSCFSDAPNKDEDNTPDPAIVEHTTINTLFTKVTDDPIVKKKSRSKIRIALWVSLLIVTIAYILTVHSDWIPKSLMIW
jgi:serine/threonine protein phosphatase PrpC